MEVVASVDYGHWAMAHTQIARRGRGRVTLCLKLTKRLGLERVEVSAEQGLGRRLASLRK